MVRASLLVSMQHSFICLSVLKRDLTFSCYKSHTKLETESQGPTDFEKLALTYYEFGVPTDCGAATSSYDPNMFA